MESSRSLKVLILDTDELFRRSLAFCLQERGCYVLEAAYQAEALEKMCGDDIDVVLMSLTSLKEESMPLLKRAKQISPLTEVILLTGQTDISLAIQCMKLGAFDDFLVPVEVESLLSRITEAWRRKRERLGFETIRIWHGMVMVAETAQPSVSC